MWFHRCLRSRLATAVGFFVATALASTGADAQRAPRKDSTKVVVPSVVVTATREPRTTFDVPFAVTFISADAMREQMPNSPVDLFRELAGLDVVGVGANQVRPAIRGQQGQRVVLLEDGLRLDNARRHPDFGELPSLVDIASVDRVEVIRSGSSVLYGPDAVGGVVNIVTRAFPARRDNAVHGAFAFRYGSADGQRRPSGTIEQVLGPFAYRVSAMHRESAPYGAPAGTFGNITLRQGERVNDTGVNDDAFDGLISYSPTETQRVAAKVERYTARDAGFGYIEPRIIGANEPLVRILFPDQGHTRYSLDYLGLTVGAIADRVHVTAYGIDNARRYSTTVVTPGAGDLGSYTETYTKLATVGGRIEATKAFARSSLTYGVDAYRDHATSRDTSLRRISALSPSLASPASATFEGADRSPVPNASFQSAGVFIENDIRLTERLSLVLGARGQDVSIWTHEAPAWSTSRWTTRERAMVGSANLLVRARHDLNLVAAVGRGYRVPNLVERFFDGPTPDGIGYQRSNPSLRPEASLGVDLGARFQNRALAIEAFVFRNELHDGIRIAATGDSLEGLPAFRNQNVDRLRFSGSEIDVVAPFGAGFETRASYTHLTWRDVRSSASTIGTTYSTKAVGALTYRSPSGRFWSNYTLRRNGRQVQEQIGRSPVGPVLPSFTVHTLRGGIQLLDRGGMRNRLELAVENLSNRLYAEAANAGFFRPAPGRNLVASWSIDF